MKRLQNEKKTTLSLKKIDQMIAIIKVSFPIRMS